MVLKDIGNIMDVRPEYFACAGEFSKEPIPLNTGVMVMNVNKLYETLEPFVNYITDNNRFTGLGAFDQGAYQTYYAGKSSPLDPLYNWKPYWGINEDAKIIHFHGPKIVSIEQMLNNEPNVDPTCRHMFNINPQSYKHYADLSHKFENFG
jgi:hypothetical protein